MPFVFKSNGTDFRRRMESRAANLKIGSQRRITLFAESFLRTVALDTPILTGKARAEWQVGIDALPTNELLGRERPPTQVDWGAYLDAAVAQLSGYQSGSTIYIVNNAPYITALNAGSSVQASANFIEVAIATATTEARGRL
jgi:hypothetical protein